MKDLKFPRTEWAQCKVIPADRNLLLRWLSKYGPHSLLVAYIRPSKTNVGEWDVFMRETHTAPMQFMGVFPTKEAAECVAETLAHLHGVTTPP